jgi:hypothetical protein
MRPSRIVFLVWSIVVGLLTGSVVWAGVLDPVAFWWFAGLGPAALLSLACIVTSTANDGSEITGTFEGTLHEADQDWAKKRAKKEAKVAYDRDVVPWTKAKDDITVGLEYHRRPPNSMMTRSTGELYDRLNAERDELTAWIDEQRRLIEVDKRVWRRVSALLYDDASPFDN